MTQTQQPTQPDPEVDADALDLASLTLDPQNARRHSARNLAAIQASLQEVGAARSIVIGETGTILADNATVEATGILGLTRVRVIDTDGTDLVAVRRTGLTPDQKRTLALADNRTAELADWDPDVLAILADDFDLSGLWEPDELADLIASTEGASRPLLTDPDEVSDPPIEPVTRPGDLWLLGPHRLLCGDATKAEDLARLMEGGQATCLWTDPPYGVNYVGKTKDALTLANDEAAGLEGLLKAAFTTVMPVMQEGASFYMAHPAGPLALTFLQVVTALDWSVRQSLVWVKDSLVLGHADYHYRHEPILYGFLPGPGRRGRGGVGWYGDAAQTIVFEIPRPKRSEAHPTMKTVAHIAAMLGNSTRPGDLVLDPFAGSGSTLIASETLGRVARMLELDPRYCDVVVGRWEELTGEPAQRLPAPEETAA
jgi:DNA modification methylase